jgi:hypothetical protein
MSTVDGSTDAGRGRPRDRDEAADDVLVHLERGLNLAPERPGDAEDGDVLGGLFKLSHGVLAGQRAAP